MASTISLADLERHADNIYEAIIIMAKRARQINDQQKSLLQQEREEEESYEEYDEEAPEEIVEKPYIKLPKPTTVALNEFLAGKIRYDYQPDEDEEAEAE